MFSCDSSSKRVLMLFSCRSNMVNVRADASFIRDNDDGTVSRVNAYFHTIPQLVNTGQPPEMEAILSDLNNQVDNWNGRGSGFIIDCIIRFVLCISTYRLLHGSTYIPTPEWLKLKHCIVNVKNDEYKCFFYGIGILSALYPATKNPDRLSHYMPYVNSVNQEGLEYPVSPKQIPTFEKKQSHSVSKCVVLRLGQWRVLCVVLQSTQGLQTSHQPSAVGRLRRPIQTTLLLDQKNVGSCCTQDQS